MTKHSFGEIIQELKTAKGLSEELIQIVLEDCLKAAYKKRFDTDDNATIIIDFDNNEIALYAKKTIVKTVNDEVFEIDIASAQALEPESEEGDQLLIEFNMEDFSRTEIAIARQKTIQLIREFEGDSLYSEFKNKEGEIVIGYYLRENNNNIYVDLGKTEGVLTKRYQSVREIHQSGDRIKALIHEVRKQGNRFEVLLTRTHSDFIKKIFELEVPEIYDGVVEIVKIVREPGYRTKMAVRSSQADVDPIGTCVGTKGVRINTVMLELDNERIDILRYDSDPLTFIHNALSPADVKQVIITDFTKRTAMAVVEDDKLSIAIGKLGLNVKLANRLTDWSIDIKTISQFQEMEGTGELELFDTLETDEGEEVDIKKVSELTDLESSTRDKLLAAKIEYIEDLFQFTNANFQEFGLDAMEIRKIRSILQGVESADGTRRDGEHDDTNETDDETDDNTNETDDEQDENLKVDILPFYNTVLAKIQAHNIILIYDLVALYTEKRLSEITSITEDEVKHIIAVIEDNIELE